MKKRKSNKLILGVGINDADYVVQPTVNGKTVVCPVMSVLINMLVLCYHAVSLDRYPTYKGCSVSAEWLSFMAFKEWMINQDWLGMHLDKDILVPGNKVYGKDFCVFVPPALNGFTLDSRAARGEWPIGVYWHKESKNFRAQCQNPFTKKYEYLGRFSNPDAAHEAWRAKKHEHALKLAAQQTDPRLAKALSTRYLKEGDEND